VNLKNMKKINKITLIRPNIGNYRSLDAFPPLAMGILASRIPKDIETVFYDDRCEEIPLDEPTDLVAMSVETFTARRAYLLADIYRANGVPVVMGGHHPTLLPEEALRHADAVVTGDAEGVWEELLDDFRHGSMKDVYDGGRGVASDYRLDRSIFDGKRYAGANLVQHGRGCRHNCEFCSVRAFYGNSQSCYAPRDTAKDIALMKRGHPRRLLVFVDDNLYSSPQAMTELMREIRPIGVRWACQISADVVRDSKIMDMMAESGCAIALVGFESMDLGNIDAMNKGWTRLCGDNEAIVNEFHSRGIAVCGAFVFGYDGDSKATIEAAVDFVRRSRIEIAQLNLLMPLPGTAFYERLERSGRLLRPGWWADPAYRCGDPIIAPLGMDPDEFARLCFDAKKRIYSWGSVARRILLPGCGFNIWNMTFVGLANLISRHEVYRKQFRLLGV
jgi:radical SAM superfamily enzyme YgiQ (UPF0313 family)